MLRRPLLRTALLVTLATVVLWYALLDGRSSLAAVAPDVARFAPQVSSLATADPSVDLFQWPSALLLGAIVALFMVKRSRFARQVSARRVFTTLAERTLWAEHLSWLRERAATSGGADETRTEPRTSGRG
jgi:hypothetical protein